MSVYERAANVDIEAVRARFPEKMRHLSKKFDTEQWRYTDETEVIMPMSGALGAGMWGDDVVRVVCAMVEEIEDLRRRLDAIKAA